MSDNNSKNDTECSSDTGHLIDSLVEELTPVKCMEHPLKRACYWFAIAFLYALFVIAFMGLRPDFFTKLSEPVYVFEIILAFIMSLSGALSSHWLCVPDMRGQNWLLSVSLTLFAVLASWIIINVFVNFIKIGGQMHFSHCMVRGVIFGIIPSCMIVFLSLRGKTTQPALMVIMNLLAVGGLVYLCLRFTCGCDNIGHIVIHHILPFFIIGGGISLIGRKIYHW